MRHIKFILRSFQINTKLVVEITRTTVRKERDGHSTKTTVNAS